MDVHQFLIYVKNVRINFRILQLILFAYINFVYARTQF